MTLTETIARLRELEAKATPGPWQETTLHDIYSSGNVPNSWVGRTDFLEDAKLIAALRKALPALLDAAERAGDVKTIGRALESANEMLEAAEAERDRLREALQRIDNLDQVSGYDVSEADAFAAIRIAREALAGHAVAQPSERDRLRERVAALEAGLEKQRDRIVAGIRYSGGRFNMQEEDIEGLIVALLTPETTNDHQG